MSTMNGDYPTIDIKTEPTELNGTLPQLISPPPPSLSPSLVIQSPPIPATRTATAAGNILADIAGASHSSTPDVYSVKSPTAERSPPAPTTAPSTNANATASAPVRNPLASLPSAKRKRLPQDKVGQLEDRIALDARDADAWLSLIKEHQSKGKISDARTTYDRFLKIFPDLASQWRNYADMELTEGEFLKVEEIFQNCLLNAWSVDIFNFYLDYIRRRNDVLTGGEKARTTILKAYDFVISIVGVDKDSGQIWADYLDFVKSIQADAKWKEQQKMDQLRSIYQRAVCIPLENLETLWQQYNAFENDLNKTTARKFVQERSPAYMQARSALRHMRTIMGGLNRSKIPTPPMWTPAERQELESWTAWIEWEKTNPLILENEAAVYSRVLYAYKQAVMNMRFYPELWYSAAEYAKSKGKETEAVEFVKNGIKANKLSFLLHYQYAEHEEENAHALEVRTTLESLINNIGQEYEKMNKMAEFMKMQIDLEAEADTNMPSEGQENEQQVKLIRQKDRQARKELIDQQHQARIDNIGNDATNAWIALMHSTRRMEGIKAARQIFAKARKSKPLSHHIFIASAMMEFHCNDDKAIASKVFELGLKSYHDKVDYVLRYLNFLIQINDEPNARALFERTVSKLSPPAAKPLFDRFYEYECEFGDTEAIRKLSKRIAGLYPEESNLTRFIRRYARYGVNPIGVYDLAPPVTPVNIQPSNPAMLDDDVISVTSSRANSVAPSEMDEPKRAKVDRFGRQLRQKANSPDPRTVKKTTSNKRELPTAIMDFLAALPPASMFDGATFHIDELIKLIRNARVPYPPGFVVDAKRARVDDEEDARGTKKVSR